jgi:parallel beta-helix repeat protein
MKGGYAIPVFLMLLLSGFSFTAAVNVNDTIYVDDDGTADYANIQDAVDAAVDGDTVFVYSGIYHEHITFESKSITLQGENKETTIIDGDNEKSTIWIEKATGITISGFTLQHSGRDWMESGIVLWDCSDCTISDNIMINCGWGLYLGISTDVSVNNNEMRNNVIGMQITGTKHSEIKRNNINDNSHLGIYLNNAGFDTITENNFINNERHLSFYGVYFNDLDANYWDQKIDTKIKPFIGKLFGLIPIPGLIFDFHPASEPYAIGAE